MLYRSCAKASAGVRLHGLEHLYPADAGDKHLVLHLRGAAVRRKHGAIVHVVVQPGRPVDILEGLAFTQRAPRSAARWSGR